MDHHFRILQQRRQPVAISPRDVVHHAIGPRRRQHLERAGHEVVQRQEENLHSGHHHTDVRHQLAVLVPVGEQHRKNINGQQEAPEQQRAFLPRPQRRNFIKCGKVAIAVGYHVRDGKVIAEEKIFEAERCEENQAASGHPGLPRTFD